MTKKTIVSKSVKYLMLASVLGTTSLSLMNGVTASAAVVQPEISEIIAESNEAQNSAISYVDKEGYMQVLPIAEGATVSISGSNRTLTIKTPDGKVSIDSPQELVLKGITISGNSTIGTDSLAKITIDGVTCQRGLELSKLTNLEEVVVKDSSFGTGSGCCHGWSFSISKSAKLTSLVVDNSTFEDDFQIASNKSLATAYVSESTFKQNVRPKYNKKGYFTEFVNNTFVRDGKKLKYIGAGCHNEDIFFINRTGEAIGMKDDKRFDATKDGKVTYTTADGEKKDVVVPAGVNISSVSANKDTYSFKLSNKETFKITGATELTFRNVNITGNISFGTSCHKTMNLESLRFVYSKTSSVKVNKAPKLKNIKIHGTEMTNPHSCKGINFSNNEALERFVVQDSEVYSKLQLSNSSKMNSFVMNNVYAPGYVEAYRLGTVELEISNTKFDNILGSTQGIAGEAGRQTLDNAPIIKANSVAQFEPGNEVSYEEFLKAIKFSATDVEDGDLTDKVEVIGFEEIDFFEEGEYPVSFTVTDSDYNKVTFDIMVVVVF